VPWKPWLANAKSLVTLELLAETIPIRKLVSGIHNAATAVGNHSRVARAGMAFARSFLSSISRVLHILWLQITGCFFALFALVCANATLREYRGYTTGKALATHVWLLGSVAALFAYFAITSFLHARRRGARG